MVNKTLLKQRNRKKRAKPKFMRQEYWKHPRLKKTWRKPKGNTSKLRRHWRNHGQWVSAGHGSPAEVRGLNRQGFKEILVHNPADLESLNPQTEMGLIGRTVGRKKRLEIAKAAEQKGVKLAKV